LSYGSFKNRPFVHRTPAKPVAPPR
jgi:hypothetical protein